MTRKMVAAPLNILCVLALADAGCRVYDSSLVAELPRAVQRSDAGVMTSAQSADGDAAVGDNGEDLKPHLAACGNGQVDEAERCDIAIPRGQPGACPEVCTGRDGCFKQHLAGKRCGARCEEVEITETVPDDGCCPAGATTETDNDCSPSCGNGTLEAGETCDPIEKCPSVESCTSSEVCMLARFSGSPDNCTARCEVRPVEECISGDECCPSGCDYAHDHDCPDTATTTTSNKPTRQGGDGGVSTPAPSDAAPADCTEGCPSEEPTTCTSVHSAGACESCDCAYCSDPALACLKQANPDQRAACTALIDCATKNHCTGTDCYCGALDLPTCERFPLGACVSEIRKLTGLSDVYQLVALAANPQSSIGRAASFLDCRSQHCARACGL